MIRQLRAEDLHETVSIWYSASVQAHSFIPKDFWNSQKEAMRKEYLPNCESWVYEVNNKIVGFVAYYDGFIPAVFVSPEAQSQGIGRELLNFLKKKYKKLSLAVYAENEKAHNFYLREGFIDSGTKSCDHTGHKEIIMSWKSET